ncbi:Fic family protein [Enterovibrio makurazakiensis]|uniref:Fic family protein n=1 Tax=Enterovibrio makurazakiensis TaxID=2910232 RepID=UPI003D19B219
MKENPVGYEWLREHYELKVVERSVKSYTGGLIGVQGTNVRVTHGTTLQNFAINLRPDKDCPVQHAVFAIKREGVEISYFRCLAEIPDFTDRLIAALKEKSTSKFLRIIWFLCEWLSGRVLPVEDCIPSPYITILDEGKYYTCKPVNSTRHRLKNNIIGTPAYTAIVRKTGELEATNMSHLKEQASALFNTWSPNLISRASRFLVSKETRSSSEIEQERFSQDKAIRFNEALLRAGKTPLSKDHFTTIHSIIKGNRAELDYRAEQNWIGGASGVELPTAKPEYVEDLMDGWFELYGKLSESDIPSPVQAGILSSTFVYIHPYMDGNGRISRYIIQECLCRSKTLPEGLILPVSNGILTNIHSYYDTLNEISSKIEAITDYVEENHQLYIETDNKNFFRDLDITNYTIYLSGVMVDVATNILPKEIDTMIFADKLYEALASEGRLDLSAKQLRTLVMTIIQNDNTLSKRKAAKLDLSIEERDFINEVVTDFLAE